MLYYLDVCTSEFQASDSEGCEYASLEDAKRSAILSLREIMSDRIKRGKRLEEVWIDIRSSDLTEAVRVVLADALS